MAAEQPHLLQEPVADLRSLSEAAIDAVYAAWWTALNRPQAVRQALRSEHLR